MEPLGSKLWVRRPAEVLLDSEAIRSGNAEQRCADGYTTKAAFQKDKRQHFCEFDRPGSADTLCTVEG